MIKSQFSRAASGCVCCYFPIAREVSIVNIRLKGVANVSILILKKDVTFQILRSLLVGEPEPEPEHMQQIEKEPRLARRYFKAVEGAR